MAGINGECDRPCELGRPHDVACRNFIAVEPHAPLRRWYRVEYHRHGKGGWRASGRRFDSRILAEAWARNRRMIPVEDAVNGSRWIVYRIVKERGAVDV